MKTHGAVFSRGQAPSLNTSGHRGTDSARTRVAIVEIGSRATRLLVADVVGEQLIETITTRVEDTRLMESVQLGEVATRTELAKICGIVDRFRNQATRLAPDIVTVFGTEAIRQIEQLQVFRSSSLAGSIDEILDGRTEAVCSLMAGLSGLKAAKVSSRGFLVIDQGAGSMELATGLCSPSVEMLDFSSAKLGGNTLLKLLREHRHNIKSFRESVLPIVDKCKTPSGAVEQVVIQGTVATKCAWLVQRSAKSEKYDPRRVHGTRMQTDQLEMIIGLVEKFSLEKQPANKWAELQEFVNPGEYGGDAGERVASGVVPLVHLLHRLGKKEFVVSAYGTRHGMAWRLAHRTAASDRGKELEALSFSTTDATDSQRESESMREPDKTAEFSAPLSPPKSANNVKVERKRARRKKVG